MFHRSSPSLRDHMRMASCVPGELIPCAFVWHDPGITPCCKSRFALGFKNSPGCRRDFHVKMWGTSSPDDKLTGDLGNAFAAEIGGRRSNRLTTGKLSPGNFGLLQQYLPTGDICSAANYTLFDHRVGTGEQCRRYGDAERLRRDQADREIELGRLLDR